MTNPIRVMIVEDDPSTLFLHKNILTMTDDIKVVGTADNREDAIEKALTLKPDVMLLDINLTRKEDQHGIDIAITLSLRLPETKIIMLSGLLNEDTVRSTMGIGVACNYLLKENVQELANAVRGAVKGASVMEGSVIDFILQDYQESLKSTMDKLTTHQLKILELFYREYNVEDVAKILSVEEQSVRNHQQTIAKRCLGWKWRFKKLTTHELAQRAKVMGLF